MSKPERGDPCPKCKGQLSVKPNQFFLSGIGTFSGLVCEACKALWNDPEDDFMGAAIRRGRLRRELGKGDQDPVPPVTVEVERTPYYRLPRSLSEPGGMHVVWVEDENAYRIFNFKDAKSSWRPLTPEELKRVREVDFAAHPERFA